MNNVSTLPIRTVSATAPRARQHKKHHALHATGATSLHPDDLMIVTQALNILERSVRHEPLSFSSPKTTKDWLALHYGLLTREVFGVLLLDTRNRLLAHEQIFTGTLDSTAIYPREVIRCVMHHNAGAVIAVHNHPTGLNQPSRDDELITRHLKDALALVGVRLLDHFIVAGTDILSFAERGLL